MQAQEITSCVIFTPHGNEPDFVSFEIGERCKKLFIAYSLFELNKTLLERL